MLGGRALGVSRTNLTGLWYLETVPRSTSSPRGSAIVQCQLAFPIKNHYSPPIIEESSMRAFTQHQGLVAPMDRQNVDTDQIIPKQFLKRIERTGFGQFLFFDWRLKDDGSENPEFELNRPEFREASVLVVRKNFGCGSSREHAPWALEDFGFRVLIAPSFADIFYNNCFKNGILPIKLTEEQVEDLFQRTSQHPGYRLNVDLEQQTIADEFGLKLSFEVDAFRKHSLLNGLDDIGMTLANEDKIAAYESARGIA